MAVTDEQWKTFDINCTAGRRAPGQWIVTFGDRRLEAPLTTPPPQRVPQGATVYVFAAPEPRLLSFHPPENPVEGIAQDDYVEKAFAVVRERIAANGQIV